MDGRRQPLLHDAAVVLAAPAQAWSRPDGRMSAAIDGWYLGDVRVLSACELTVSGSGLEHLRTERTDAATLRFTSLVRGLDDGIGADPRVQLERVRCTTPTSLTEQVTLISGLRGALDAEVSLRLACDFAAIEAVKAGAGGEPARWCVEAGTSGETARAASGGVSVAVTAPGAQVVAEGDHVVVRWQLSVPPGGSASVQIETSADDTAAVVVAPARRVALTGAATTAWSAAALRDLEALQLELPALPGATFVAAGAPWFLTLFGRDALWTARMLLPHGLALAEGTLRVLAALAGVGEDPDTAEQPGRIVHELRRAETSYAEGMTLPARYYGTVDATPLWVLLLHDAWRAGLPDAVVRELLPTLRGALAWQRDYGCARTGFVEYVDASGHGLSNQGWKDSGDSVQWHDGRLAQGPIALVEVQGYAHEAALAGAAILEALGEPGAPQWRAWAADLRSRFRPAFWVTDGDYPAIALDASGAAVDSLTSNIGHLLGTGLLDARDEARVAELLVDPRLDSGFGLRTLATDSGGYWPLSYHGGSVWAHDTAIAILGLMRTGHHDEAHRLATGLEAAAAAFDHLMPELHGGQARGQARGPAGASSALPLPYPAACRPQAWSAAAALVAARALDPSATAPENHSTPVHSTPVHSTPDHSTPDPITAPPT